MVYGIFYTFPQSPLLAFHRIISDGWPKLQSFSLGLQKDPCTCFSDRNSSFVSIFHLLCVVRHFPSCVTPEEKASLLAYSHLLKGQLLHYTQSLCEEEIPHVLSATQRKPSRTVCLVNTIPFAWKSLLLWYKYFPIFKLVSSKK